MARSITDVPAGRIASLITAAAKDVGVREVPRGSNRGPRVEAMLATTGLGPGYPWCAAAVATWGREALGTAWPLPLTADCDVLLSFAQRRGILRTSPAVGDVFLILSADDDDDARHTGVVTAVDSSGEIATVEGNTNDNGSAEGYGVFARRRGGHAVRIVYARWADLLDDASDSRDWQALIGSGSPPSVMAMEIVDGVGYVPLRLFLRSLFGAEADARLGWSVDDGGPTWDRHALPFTCRLEAGASWCPLRRAAGWQGLAVEVDAAKRIARVTRIGAEPDA
jgi:hypothetical protein